MNTNSNTTNRLGLAPGDLSRIAGLGFIHFVLLGAYFLLKPVRDEVASDLGSEHIDTLWTWVFFVNLAIAPIYAYFVKSRTRLQVLAGVLGFFAVAAGLFSVAFSSSTAATRHQVESAFYVWSAVLPLLAVSSFWSFVSDVCSLDRARRIFGYVAAVGTAGSIAGSAALGQLTESKASVATCLLIFAAAFAVGIPGAIACERSLRDEQHRSGLADASSERIGGTILSGLVAVGKSRFLVAICGFILLMTLSSSAIYFVQSDLLRVLVEDRGERRAFLGDLNEIQGWITLVGQAGLTTLFMRRIGVGTTLVALPVVAIVCVSVVWWFGSDWFVFQPAVGDEAAKWVLGANFDQSVATYGASTLLSGLGAIIVAMGVARYAFAKPAREALFTLVTRDERFKSKNFIDTAVYRGGDVVSAQLFGVMMATGLVSVTSIGAVALPAFAGWAVLAVLLGRSAKRRSA